MPKAEDLKSRLEEHQRRKRTQLEKESMLPEWFIKREDDDVWEFKVCPVDVSKDVILIRSLCYPREMNISKLDVSTDGTNVSRSLIYNCHSAYVGCALYTD